MLQLSVVGVSGSTSVIEVDGGEAIASVAWRLRNGEGTETKCPLLVSGERTLPYDATVASADLSDGAELRVVQVPCKPWPCGLDVVPLPKQPALDPAALPDLQCSELCLAGRSLSAGLHALIPQLPASLTTLDVRRCELDSGETIQLFQALPTSLEHLRASDNTVGVAALRCLESVGCSLRTLDVAGEPVHDLADDDTEPDVASLAPLVGTHTEELCLEDLSETGGFALLLRRCSSLRLFQFEEDCPAIWPVLAECCPRLEEVRARRCQCTGSDFSRLVSSCPQLRVLILGDADALEGTQPDRCLEVLRVSVRTMPDMIAATKLKAEWLSINFVVEVAEDISLDVLAGAVGDIVATDVELHLPCVNVALLKAVGTRLRTIWANGSPLLPSLAAVAQTHACLNLMQFDVDLWEQVSAEHVATVAASCPLLELVRLNADGTDVQTAPIDAGVRALGLHCRHLRHLDLYKRRMAAAAEVLAKACEGWPKLRYLCAAGTCEEEWGSVPEQECLPRALAKYCPLLEEFVLYDVPTAWKPIVDEGCPFLCMCR